MPGALLSTLLPLIGPAVTELPTASDTARTLVEVLAVSVPADTFVVRLKLESAALARPEPPSAALQAIETSAACHSPSAEPQDSAGAFLSTLLPVMSAGEAAQLETLSQAWTPPAVAEAWSV